MLHFTQLHKAVSIDLRDTQDTFDLHENPWVRNWTWLAPIHQRGFGRFEVVDSDLCFALGRTTLIVTVMDDFGEWYEVKFVLESTRDVERRAGAVGFNSLLRALGLTEIEDTEELVGRKGAFRVASAAGDIDFMPLSALDA